MLIVGMLLEEQHNMTPLGGVTYGHKFFEIAAAQQGTNVNPLPPSGDGLTFEGETALLTFEGETELITFENN